MSEIHTLMKSQKNEVFEFIRTLGLEPANFSWINENRMPSVDKIVPRLNYLDGEYFFRFDLFEGRPYCYFSPGWETLHESHRSESWFAQMSYVANWLSYLKRETQAPDLWQEMEKYRATISLTPSEQITNEPISVSEVDQIARDLSLLADKIEQQFQLTEEQNQFVRTKLDYLAEAAKRQRSADWVHTAIGVFATMAMGLAMAPDQTRELWQLIKSLLGGFIHLIGP